MLKKTVEYLKSFWGYLGDYLSGGNIKVAASSLAKLHFRCNGDYLTAYQIRVLQIIDQSLTEHNVKTDTLIDMACNNAFKNYVDVAVLDLYINAAPAWTLFYELQLDFSSKLAKYLIKKHIPTQYIIGDNRHLTQEFVNSMRGVD